ncbi:MAG: hypothetical protein ACTSRP_21030 [Candidatus Helarchaeota archaeon]
MKELEVNKNGSNSNTNQNKLNYYCIFFTIFIILKGFLIYLYFMYGDQLFGPIIGGIFIITDLLFIVILIGHFLIFFFILKRGNNKMEIKKLFNRFFDKHELDITNKIENYEKFFKKMYIVIIILLSSLIIKFFESLIFNSLGIFMGSFKSIEKVISLEVFEGIIIFLILILEVIIIAMLSYLNTIYNRLFYNMKILKISDEYNTDFKKFDQLYNKMTEHNYYIILFHFLYYLLYYYVYFSLKIYNPNIFFDQMMIFLIIILNSIHLNLVNNLLKDINISQEKSEFKSKFIRKIKINNLVNIVFNFCMFTFVLIVSLQYQLSMYNYFLKIYSGTEFRIYILNYVGIMLILSYVLFAILSIIWGILIRDNLIQVKQIFKKLKRLNPNI